MGCLEPLLEPPTCYGDVPILVEIQRAPDLRLDM